MKFKDVLTNAIKKKKENKPSNKPKQNEIDPDTILNFIREAKNYGQI